MILASTGLNINEELNYLRILQTKQVDGIIFMATEVTEEHKDVIRCLNIPIVIVGQEIEGYHCIVHDEVKACREITELLISNNHKDIAFITVKQKDTAIKYKRFQGFKEAMTKEGLPIKDKWIQEGDFSIESGTEAMERIWNSTEEKPTAVIAVNDNMAFGALSFLLDNGIKVPEECSLVGFGNSKFSKHINPKLTTVDYYFEAEGERAAENLFKRIKEKSIDNNMEYIPYKIIERESIFNIN